MLCKTLKGCGCGCEKGEVDCKALTLLSVVLWLLCSIEVTENLVCSLLSVSLGASPSFGILFSVWHE